jgi:hypothetical protein
LLCIACNLEEPREAAEEQGWKNIKGTEDRKKYVLEKKRHQVLEDSHARRRASELTNNLEKENMMET